MKFFAVFATLLFAAFGSAAAAQSDRYAEGQVWQYRTRPGEDASLLKIQKIETTGDYAKLGPVYHISVIGIKFANPAIQPVLPHAPVSRATLDASVTQLSARTDGFPTGTEVATGIDEWRRAKGGVFTVTVAEVLGFVDSTLGKAN